MKALVFILISLFLFSASYPLVINNEGDVSLTTGDILSMLDIVSQRYDFEITEIHTYYEKNVLVYEFKGYKSFKEGYVTREIPYSLKLNENLEPLEFVRTREDRIGYLSIFLGIPGIISYLIHTSLGVI